MSKYKKQLTDMATKFVSFLAQHGVDAYPTFADIQEFSLPINFFYNSQFNLYYSPKKDSYKVYVNRGTDSDSSRIMDLWDEFNGVKVGKKSPHENKGISVYTDGSYLDGMVGFGAVILKDGKKIFELSGRLIGESVRERNIAGEVEAVIQALSFCMHNGLSPINVYYDLKNIGHWARREWKANSISAQRLQTRVNTFKGIVNFVKVTAHTGVVWNEYVDALAKKGATQTAFVVSDEQPIGVQDPLKPPVQVPEKEEVVDEQFNSLWKEQTDKIIDLLYSGAPDEIVSAGLEFISGSKPRKWSFEILAEIDDKKVCTIIIHYTKMGVLSSYTFSDDTFSQRFPEIKNSLDYAIKKLKLFKELYK